MHQRWCVYQPVDAQILERPKIYYEYKSCHVIHPIDCYTEYAVLKGVTYELSPVQKQPPTLLCCKLNMSVVCESLQRKSR